MASKIITDIHRLRIILDPEGALFIHKLQRNYHLFFN